MEMFGGGELNKHKNVMFQKEIKITIQLKISNNTTELNFFRISNGS